MKKHRRNGLPPEHGSSEMDNLVRKYEYLTTPGSIPLA